MSAFVVAKVKVKDPVKFQQYAQQSGPTFAPFGGELLIKGKFLSSFAETDSCSSVAVIKFPSPKDLESWYYSDAYQALVALRDEAADIEFTHYEVPS